MFVHHLSRPTLKRRAPGKKLIDHDAKSILIGGRYGITLPLFRRHIDGCPANSLACARGAGRQFGNTEIGEQQIGQALITITANKEILRFDILVNEAVVVCMLEGVGCLAEKMRDIRW